MYCTWCTTSFSTGDLSCWVVHVSEILVVLVFRSFFVVKLERCLKVYTIAQTKYGVRSGYYTKSSLPIRFNCLFELGAGGFRGTHRPTCLAASTLSLGVLCGRRGTWAPCIY